MIASQARILASQNNGKKSKGPTSPEGKMISRGNSLKHGMTGEGIVLLKEDVAEVNQRFEELHAQFQPSTPMGKIMVHRIALTSVRLERCAEQEAGYLGEKVRHAKEDHDEQRQAEVAALLLDMADRPAASIRKLLRTPEGIDAVMNAWEGLRADLARPDLKHWTASHNERAHHLTGRRVEEIPISRLQELSTAIWGDFDLIGEAEGAGLDLEDRRAWARDLLMEWIDEELAALRTCREGIDLEAFERDREEAPKRALFDLSKAAILARRYEAANERAMFRALKELQKLEKEAAANPKPSPACPVGPSGSFFPASKPSSEPVEAFEAEAELMAIEAFGGRATSIPGTCRGDFTQESTVPAGREARVQPLLSAS